MDPGQIFGYNKTQHGGGEIMIWAFFSQINSNDLILNNFTSLNFKTAADTFRQTSRPFFPPSRRLASGLSQ